MIIFAMKKNYQINDLFVVDFEVTAFNQIINGQF